MQPPVIETLSALERRLDLEVPLADVEIEVQRQLAQMRSTAKVPGFRPGKVPLKTLERSHGLSLRQKAISTQVKSMFEQVIEAADLKLAGPPKVEPKLEPNTEENLPHYLAFTATFEVLPEFSLPELSSVQVTRFSTEVGETEVEQTLKILCKQRIIFKEDEQRSAQNGDRITLDFTGTIEQTPFAGGSSENYVFVLGEAQMLPDFEQAIQGLKVGESKVFSLKFPENYQSQAVAGKTAEFTITIKKIELAVWPELDADFAKSLGQTEGDLDKLRTEILNNLQRESELRSHEKTKENVMSALVEAVNFEVPKVMIEQELKGRVAAAQAELKQRGISDSASDILPMDLFSKAAQRSVRMRLLISKLIKQANLKVQPEQVRARIEKLAQNYEDPAQVLSHYLSNRERRAEIEAIVLEDNLVAHILERAQINQEQLPFKQLMGIE